MVNYLGLSGKCAFFALKMAKWPPKYLAILVQDGQWAPKQLAIFGFDRMEHALRFPDEPFGG